MAKIIPFKAVFYNQEKIKDLAKVVCPPYDVISKQRQQYYHDLDPYNYIHLDFAKDIPGENKYRRSAGYFKDWLKDKVFVRDDNPAIYFYNQQYNLKGEKKTRLGFISLLHLDSKIFGHERTHLEAKEDRLKLIRATKANLSPIFVIFSDHKRVIQSTLKYLQDKKPFIDILDDDKVAHKLWRIDSPDILEKIQQKMKAEDIFIADGHHRYEVACSYREEMKKKLNAFTGEEDFNYVMTYFTNTDFRGLTILPIHRLLKLASVMDINDLIKALSEYFHVEEVKDKTRFTFLMEKGGQTEHVLGMYKDKKYWLLRLKNVKILDKMISGKSPGYRSLDVSILNFIVLKQVLGVDLEDKERLIFSPNAAEFIESVDKHPTHIAFLLNPVKAQAIISLALNNEKMPPKTTYFYPKVLSGLLINKHG
jgi:uncharacterized protein (DUF1015 family)